MQGHSSHADMVSGFRRRFWVCLVLTLPILILSPLIQQVLRIESWVSFPGDRYVLFGLSSIVFFYGGWPFLQGLFNELKQRSPGMMTLIALAIAVAYGYSTAVIFGLEGKMFMWELATLIDIMLLGHWIEMKSVMGAGKALEQLAALMPSDAHKMMADGSVEDVPLDQLAAEDKVIVKPGEKVPADALVLEGESSVNEAMLTGESKPVTKVPGDAVIGGSVNGEGSLIVQVQKTGADSFLSQVIELVKEAQASKSKTQDLANRAALWLTIIALSAGAITFIVWLLIGLETVGFALQRTVTVMVITCPHALGLAVPLVVAVSTALAAGSGLLIRNRVAFEQARNLNAVVFDKTGTLTEGRFSVTDVISLDPDHFDEKQLLALAAAVESHSEHPIAQGIVRSVEKLLPVQDFKAIPGKGARGSVEGHEVAAVSPSYLRERNLEVEDERLNKLKSEAKTTIFVVADGAVRGCIALADTIREESRAAVATLKVMGIECIMLTGDNAQVADWVSKEIGLDEFIAGVLPTEKAAKVAAIQERGLRVAMTGDGVNDAPALAQADVGIAIGAGTDVAVETADIILVRNNPLDVVAIVDLARATYKKMIQNLLWATGYNAVAIPLAAGVLYRLDILLTPAVAAIFMSLSTVIVAINAKMLRFKRR